MVRTLRWIYFLDLPRGLWSWSERGQAKESTPGAATLTNIATRDYRLMYLKYTSQRDIGTSVGRYVCIHTYICIYMSIYVYMFFFLSFSFSLSLSLSLSPSLSFCIRRQVSYMLYVTFLLLSFSLMLFLHSDCNHYCLIMCVTYVHRQQQNLSVSAL